jgi:hypothetical protein
MTSMSATRRRAEAGLTPHDRGALAGLRRRAAALAVGVVATAMAPAVTAYAVEGPAPEPVEYRVLEKVHTDAVSTFLDEGTFTLGTRADLPEGNGTRLDPAATRRRRGTASRQSVPAGATNS